MWFVLVVLGGSVGFLLDPSAFYLGSNLAAFVPFALLALVLVPIQTTAEEVFFRGYLARGASLISVYSLIQFVAVAALFYVAVFVLIGRHTKKGP